MTSAYPNLFSPLTLAGRVVRNRLVHTATVTGFGAAGRVSEALIAYHRARATGGAGMIVTEGMSVHASSAPNARVIALHDPANAEPLKRLAEAVEAQDCRLLGQLWHVGRQQLWSPLASPLGVSDRPDALSWTVPHVMDRSQIEELIAAFVASARTLREAGFSGAELHGAHGYLITQFLSPWSNSRDDDYGGDRIGRMRFLTKIISGIREVCGDDFILGLKMPADEGVAGGIDLAEARAITEILAAEGRLDLIAYSQGNFSLSLERHLPDMHFPSGPYLDLARSLKPVAGAMAVMALGRVTSPAQGEQVLVAGGGDLIGLSRPLIADPEMPAKTAAGREDDTRPCIHCNFCWGELVAGRAIACQQNVRLGTGDESAPEFEPPARPRRIAVVGAGLAGLEAAWLAAARGHQVVLYGASAEVGGKAGLEARLPGHEQAGLAIEFQKRRLQRHGVEERLGRPVDAETILAGDPDAVVLATGATMQAPELEPGGTAMVAATEALADLLAPAAREEGTAVLFDQDQTAPVYAVAALLARRYAKVVIATPATQLARNVPHVNAIGVHRRLFAAGIETVLGCRPASWHGGRLDLINLYTGERKSIDSVARAIYATPRRANDALAAPLAAAGVPVHLIGDSFAPRNALAAMGEARTTALAL